MSFLFALLILTQEIPVDDIPDPITGEFPVEVYEQNNENAGASSFKSGKMAEAFNGQEGIKRIADEFVDRLQADERIAEIFIGQDEVRLRRTLYEQFCFILNAGCDYSGRDMKTAHRDLGIQSADMNALVENLQEAMKSEGVPFAQQNRFLAKLAPMRGDIVTR